MKQKISVGILGFGTVGAGTVRILTSNADLIRSRVGVPVEIRKIAVRDVRRRRETPFPQAMLTADALSVVDDPEIDIVVELIGGCEDARELALRAMANGKHFVTANKALLATYGLEIQQAAARAGVRIGFEASACGAIPVVKALRESLAGNRILSIYGIINGTSNYILTRMTEDGRPFAEVLAEAQRLGYAEADPALDIGGMDAAQKLAILISLASGAFVDVRDIYTEGIEGVRPIDIEFGKEFGYTLKLLAIAKFADGRIEARVHPTMIPSDYAIAKIGGVYNAVQITGDACGDILLSGRGAGSLPTGSAVVADILDIARYILSEPASRPAAIPDSTVWTVQPIHEIRSIYYLRFMALDKPGVLSQISAVLGRNDISIASMVQRGRKEGAAVPLVIMTHTALERDVRKSFSEVMALSCVPEPPVLMRVEGSEI